MSYGRCMSYAKLIDPLGAQEMQRQITVSSFPHMKKEQMKKVEKQLKRAARPTSESDVPNNTEELYHKMLRTLGNG